MSEDQTKVKAGKVENVVAALPPEDEEVQDSNQGIQATPEQTRHGITMTVAEEDAEAAVMPVETGDPVQFVGKKQGSSVVLGPPEESEEINEEVIAEAATAIVAEEEVEAIVEATITVEEAIEVQTEVKKEDEIEDKGSKITTPVDQATIEGYIDKLKKLAYWQRQKPHIDKIENIDILRALAEEWPKGNLGRVINERIEQLEA